jgi:predicted membrane GTPase involved in stress response
MDQLHLELICKRIRQGHKIAVDVDEDYMHAIIGDLNSRRGRIEGMEMVG